MQGWGTQPHCAKVSFRKVTTTILHEVACYAVKRAIGYSYHTESETLIGASHFSEMKRDIRMTNYEKRGKQEAAYPSLLPMPHCLVTVMFEPPVSLVFQFAIIHIPLHYTFTYFWLYCSYNHWRQAPRKNSGRYRFKKCTIDIHYCDCSKGITLYIVFLSVCFVAVAACRYTLLPFPFYRVKLPSRKGASRIMATGMFPDAEVVRGHDWIWGNQDGIKF